MAAPFKTCCFLSRQPIFVVFMRNSHGQVNTKPVQFLANDNWQLIPKPKKMLLRTGKRTVLPERIKQSCKLVVEQYRIPNLMEKSFALSNAIWSRKLPLEQHAISFLEKTLEEKMRTEDNINLDAMTEQEKEEYNFSLKKRCKISLLQRVNKWRHIKFDALHSIVYLTARGPYDYAALHPVFKEIKVRDPNYVPSSVFDFGSGVGTVTWATHAVWPCDVDERLCVDSSSHMNTVAQLVLQDGSEDSPMFVPNVYFRQFMSASKKEHHSLVVSAFSLLELPNVQTRLKTVELLWKMTKDYLVIMENGSLSGYRCVQEVRQFLLNIISQKPKDNEGYIFSPCPHELMCPQLYRHSKLALCNFGMDFEPLFKLPANYSENHVMALSSYLVMKKGRKPDKIVPSCPRVAGVVKKSKGKVTCKLCTSRGSLEVAQFTKKKHGAKFYKNIRSCSWGDILPVVDKEVQGDLCDPALDDNEAMQNVDEENVDEENVDEENVDEENVDEETSNEREVIHSGLG